MSVFVGSIANPGVAGYTLAPTTSNNAGVMNAVFGQSNANMMIQVESVRFDCVVMIPSDDSQIKLNDMFSKVFEVEYIDCVCNQFPQQYTISNTANINQMQLDTKKNMCYLILVFKNANTSSVTQNYGGFVNANVNTIKIQYGRVSSQVYPISDQQDDFTMLGNTAFCSGPKHFYAEYRKLFQRFHATAEQPMSESEFRNLYTMYCFDLTDLNDISKEIDNNLFVTIQRRNGNAENFECYYLLYYKRKVKFDFTQSTPVVTVDQ